MKRMKKLAPLVFLISTCPRPADAGGFLTGNNLYQVCTAQDDELLLRCFSYLEGVTDSVGAGFFDPQYSKMICLRQGISAGQLAAVAIKYMDEYPENRDLAASINVVAALEKSFPCQ